MANWLISGSSTAAFVRLLVWALLLQLPAAGAVAERPTVIVGWTPVPGLMQELPDGRKTGFMLDLALLIAEQADFDLEFVRYETVPDLLMAQSNGQSEMLAGISDLPSLRSTSHFSLPVGRVGIHLVRLKGGAATVDHVQARGLRLAAVRGAPGSEIVGQLLLHDVITFQTAEAAIEAVVSGSVDGLVAPLDSSGAVLWAGGVAPPFEVLGPPVQVLQRVVALHRNHTDLRSRVDAALLRLEADGRLEALRHRWNIGTPLAQPDLLKVGVVNRPPYMIVDPDGQVSGFAVDVLRGLAQRAGMQVAFVPISEQEWSLGPRDGSFDLLALERMSKRRLQSMEFGLPLLTAPYSVFLRAESVPPLDWTGRRLAVLAGDLPVHLPEPYAAAMLVVYANSDDALEALLSGQVEAILHERYSLWHRAAFQGVDDRVAEHGAPVFRREYAVAARLELARQLEQLNMVTQGFLASPQYQGLRAKWLTPTGSWLTMRLSSVLGAIGAALVVLAGIGAWRHYLRRLQNARRDIAEDLIEKLPFGVLLLDPEGRITYVNEATASTKAHTSGLLHVGGLYETALRDLYATRHVVLDGRTSDEWIETQLADLKVDGRVREIRLENGVTFLRTTKLLKGGMTLLLRQDVTEERARLRQIELLNEHLHEQISLAEAATEDLRNFAYATSHDLKSPTNTARMIVRALSDELQDRLAEEHRELLADLRVTLDAMSGLIDEIQSYTNALGRDISHEEVDLDMEVRVVATEFARETRDNGASLHIGPLPRISGSPGQIRTLLANLLDNALKFRSPHRRAEVSLEAAEAPEGFVGLSVSDNGIGIDAAFHERIFQLFQRLNPVSEYRGNGLGLAICQRIALNHGGRITVESRPDAGSTFTVFFRKDSP